MEDYQKRVVTEAAELDVKINALSDFLSSDKVHEPQDDQFVLMVDQIEVMRKYHGILLDRINLF